MFTKAEKGTLRALMRSRNYFSIQTGPTICRIPVQTINGGRLKRHENIYDIIPQIHDALTSTDLLVK